VRNYQARNSLRDEMQIDDLVLFYHSSSEPLGVAGIARVCKTAYPDPTQFDRKSEYFDPGSTREDPRWFMVDLELVEKLPQFVPLAAVRAERALAGMKLLQRGMRLSVQPVEEKHFRRLLELGGARTRSR
jgi:predicted RNA-binding protein with PUA-like domain